MGRNNMPKCQHYGCHAIGVVAVPIPRRGGGHAYLCAYHAQGNLDSYSAENPTRIGNPKKNGLTFSFELEMMRPTVQAFCELGVAGFRATHDCTVDAELKSPIYEGANALKAILPGIQKLQENGALAITKQCGTHFHVGRHDYGRRERDALLPFYWVIAGRLWQAMDADNEKATRIFGRQEGRWAFGALDANSWYYRASAIGAGGYATRDALEAHPAFLNVQHTYSLEWRRAFFRNAEQYSECADLCRTLSGPIFDFAVEIVAAKAHGTYNQDAFMTKARKLGTKLARIFREW